MMLQVHCKVAHLLFTLDGASFLIGDSSSIFAIQNVEQRVLPKWDPRILDLHGPETINMRIKYGHRSAKSDYDVGCLSTKRDAEIRRPWDPGGFAVVWYHVTGLRSSRILRGRECHAPRAMTLFLSRAFPMKWTMGHGLGPATQTGRRLIKEERLDRGGERRIETSEPSHLLAPVPHPSCYCIPSPC